MLPAQAIIYESAIFGVAIGIGIGIEPLQTDPDTDTDAEFILTPDS